MSRCCKKAVIFTTVFFTVDILCLMFIKVSCFTSLYA